VTSSFTTSRVLIVEAMAPTDTDSVGFDATAAVRLIIDCLQALPRSFSFCSLTHAIKPFLKVSSLSFWVLYFAPHRTAPQHTAALCCFVIFTVRARVGLRIIIKKERIVAPKVSPIFSSSSAEMSEARASCGLVRSTVAHRCRRRSMFVVFTRRITTGR